MLILVSDLIMTSDSEQMYMLSSVNVTNHAHKTKTSKNYRIADLLNEKKNSKLREELKENK